MGYFQFFLHMFMPKALEIPLRGHIIFMSFPIVALVVVHFTPICLLFIPALDSSWGPALILLSLTTCGWFRQFERYLSWCHSPASVCHPGSCRPSLSETWNNHLILQMRKQGSGSWNDKVGSRNQGFPAKEPNKEKSTFTFKTLNPSDWAQWIKNNYIKISLWNFFDLCM